VYPNIIAGATGVALCMLRELRLGCRPSWDRHLALELFSAILPETDAN
jgi:hypothetical protein